MPSIGAFEFITLNGAIQPPGQQLEEITRPRVDNTAYRRSGIRGEVFTLKSMVDVLNAFGGGVLLQDYKDIQGTIVTVIDDTGEVWVDVAVLRVDPDPNKKIVSGVGGLVVDPELIVRALWTLRMNKQS